MASPAAMRIAGRLTDGQRWAFRIAGLSVWATMLWLVSYVFLPGPPQSGVWLLGLLLCPLLLPLGAWLLHIGFMGWFASLTAGETAGAFEVTAGAAGRGLKAGLGEAAGSTVVKLRCRECGYLETEDAKYCSRCRSAL